MKIETVLAQLGRGGFGIVDKVQDAEGNLFARKTFCPPSYVPEGETDQLRKRFKREVTTQQHLHAPEIMPVLYAELDIKKPWFLMPLADKTYEQQIQEDRSSGKVNIEALAEILNALEYLHDKGYVHRDLNPKNILHHDGHWKLSDFGAVLPPPGHTVTLTGGTVIYTEQYCAPEQKHDFHKTRAPADIYSLGCILHDIFGKGPRVPYGKQIGPGRIGLLIEKCTEPKPERRPSVRVLRGMLLPALADLGGICKVADEKSEHWLQRLETIAGWKDDDFDDFARFFAALDVGERAAGHQNEYVSSLSTPFLTRIQADALVKILGRNDGASCAVIEKYCDWAGNTAFEFGFSDSVASCLAAIFDNADAAIKAVALIALIKLGRTHNRFYVMRTMLGRCGAKGISNDLAQRFAIEIKTEELEWDFQRCVEVVEWDIKLLHSELAEFCP